MQAEPGADPRLEHWNALSSAAAAQAILPCCGSRRWAEEVSASRPFAQVSELFACSDAVWLRLSPADWDEAFASHPRIGERQVPAAATSQFAAWSHQEQSSLAAADRDVQEKLQLASDAYQHRFGRTYIVCATGRTAAEMLTNLERRLGNNEQEELGEAIEQQLQITRLRLKKWLQL